VGNRHKNGTLFRKIGIFWIIQGFLRIGGSHHSQQFNPQPPHHQLKPRDLKRINYCPKLWKKYQKLCQKLQRKTGKFYQKFKNQKNFH
jgi:hypothetical protein